MSLQGDFKYTRSSCGNMGFEVDESTFVNERGVTYGVGNLSQSQVNGKRKHASSSSCHNLQEQLQEAQRRIEEQAAENARRETELTKVSTEQQAKIDQLSLVQRYLKETDPAFLNFMAAHSTLTKDADPATNAVIPVNSTEQTTPTSKP